MDTKTNMESLTTDLLFKETFAHPHNRKLLEHFLEVYFNYEEGFLHKKLAVSYESALNKTRLMDKSMYGDLIIVIDNKIMINMEMFSTFTLGSIIKSEQYVMRIHSTQLDIGDDYSKVNKTTQIIFADKVKVKIEEEVVKKHHIFEEIDDNFEIDVIRLDLVKDLGYNLNDEFKKLLLFIGAESNKERDIIAKGDELLMDTNEWIKRYQNDESLREWVIKHHEYWAKREAHDEGLEEGREEGREEGLEEGKAKRNIEIAKNMLNEGLDINCISKVTNLSIKEVEELQNETDK